MKKLLSKDENQVSYLLENGLTEVTYLPKTEKDKPLLLNTRLIGILMN